MLNVAHNTSSRKAARAATFKTNVLVASVGLLDTSRNDKNTNNKYSGE